MAHGHDDHHDGHNDKKEKHSPAIGVPLVIGGILLIIGFVFWLAWKDAKPTQRDDRGQASVTEVRGQGGGGNAAPGQRTTTVSLTREVRAEREIMIPVPAVTEDWHVIDNRENWTICFGRDRAGIDIEFKTASGQWTSTWLTNQPVYGWRLRSQTAQSRELDANWDMDPGCRSPVPP